MVCVHLLILLCLPTICKVQQVSSARLGSFKRNHEVMAISDTLSGFAKGTTGIGQQCVTQKKVRHVYVNDVASVLPDLETCGIISGVVMMKITKLFTANHSGVPFLHTSAHDPRCLVSRQTAVT